MNPYYKASTGFRHQISLFCSINLPRISILPVLTRGKLKLNDIKSFAEVNQVS